MFLSLSSLYHIMHVQISRLIFDFTHNIAGTSQRDAAAAMSLGTL